MLSVHMPVLSCPSSTSLTGVYLQEKYPFVQIIVSTVSCFLSGRLDLSLPGLNVGTVCGGSWRRSVFLAPLPQAGGNAKVSHKIVILNHLSNM